MQLCVKSMGAHGIEPNAFRSSCQFSSIASTTDPGNRILICNLGQTRTRKERADTLLCAYQVG